ncbi:uncharacterized protein FAM241A isoform X1 [Thalassophryne amazonica]|uniref:uncharacterized protein FAM241A isoform X1 n=1 Tax=Thalassophryne amazonica TaxID=390379 RepID=UPI0014716AAD|nr:uncharacterized protein FAM241A isoform X1 [Thalassophryne amazonica]
MSVGLSSVKEKCASVPLQERGRHRHQILEGFLGPAVVKPQDSQGDGSSTRGELSTKPVDTWSARTEPELDDCERLGTLFGMMNKCLRGLGFSQMYFGDKTVEPILIVFFWVLLWFLGIQALVLVGTLCIIIIYMQK